MIIKETILDLQTNPNNRKARESLIETIIEHDWESWIDWSTKDLAETIADLQRGNAKPLCNESDKELIAIVLECAECGKIVNLKTAVEFEKMLFHKKCFGKWR